MTNSQIKEITDYAAPPAVLYIVGAVTIALSPAVYFIVKAVKHDDVLAVAALITVILTGILFASLRLWYAANVRNAIKKYEAEYGSGRIYRDFCSGKEIAGGTMKCGERYLFCKGMGVIVYCPDIAEIKNVITDVKSIPANDQIIVRMKDRKKIVIRSLPHDDRNRDRFNEIISEIMERCPDIRFNL